MNIDYVYLYLLSPLHTGGTTQEGNLVGIARESHTQFPYIPSSTIRGRLRASITDKQLRIRLFGPELEDLKNLTEEEQENNKSAQLEQGEIWVGDGSLLWLPVASLSHGVVWISCPTLLRRWVRFAKDASQTIPEPYSTNLVKEEMSQQEREKFSIYLKDAMLKGNLHPWDDWDKFIPQLDEIERVLVLPDNHCNTLMQMSLWRQVKVKLNEHKSVEGGFRYEEAIPPDTLMYFPWGVTTQANGKATDACQQFQKQLNSENLKILQIGGQESLGRGFVQQWLEKKEETNNDR